MAQLCPIPSPSHFLSCFLILCRYCLSFFCILVAWDSLSCLVGAEGLELPISAQLVRQEQQLLRQWFPRLFPNPGTRSTGIPSTAASLSALVGLRLQRLWPVAPLFHWRSCMTSWSSFRDSSVLI